MKKVLSLIIIVLFVLSSSVHAIAAPITTTEPETETYVFSNSQEDQIRIELTRTIQGTTSRVFVNDILMQESTASLLTETISTNIYSENGQTTTSNVAFSDFIYSPPEAEVFGRVPVVPEPPLYEDRNVLDEPVDNTGLVMYYTHNNEDFYYLGRGKTAYDDYVVTAYLFRSYSYNYVGETLYFNFGVGESASAISAYLGLFGAPVDAILSILSFSASMILQIATSLELPTLNVDYNYQVKINETVYFTTYRWTTYWRIDNVTENKTKWVQKSFDGGYSSNNEAMLEYAVQLYYTN